MFTWICPQCGREVPPAYTECPDCTPRNVPAGAAPPPPAPGSEPPQQGMQAAQAEPRIPPPQPPYTAPQPGAPPQYYAPPAPPPSRGMPTWLMTVVFAMAFVGLGAGVYWIVGYLRSRPATKPAAVVESPAAKTGAAVNPYQKYIEASGVRFVEDPKNKNKTLVKFVIVNHSPAEILGLKGNVTVWGSTTRSEEDAQGTFTFQADLKPYESKELTEPLITKKEVYELADWQNLTTDVQITGPGPGDSPGQ
jgi:hypothetical protein